MNKFYEHKLNTMKSKHILSILFMGAVLLSLSCKDQKKASSIENTETAAAYYCPMHCEGEKTYTEEGSCPVCKMDLVKKSNETHGVMCQCKDGEECTCPAGECKCDTKTSEHDHEAMSKMHHDGDKEKMCQCKEGECTCEKGNCKCGTPGYDHFGNKIDDEQDESE